MSLNLNEIQSTVESHLRNKGLNVSSEIKDNGTRLVSSVKNASIKDYKDDVLITVIINQNGVCTFRLVFDKINNLTEASRAINALNDYSLWFKGYVSTGENPFFYLDNVCYDLSNASTIGYWLDDMIKFLLDDKFDTYLRPVLSYTR